MVNLRLAHLNNLNVPGYFLNFSNFSPADFGDTFEIQSTPDHSLCGLFTVAKLVLTT